MSAYLLPRKWLFPRLKAELKGVVWTIMGIQFCQEALKTAACHLRTVTEAIGF